MPSCSWSQSRIFGSVTLDTSLLGTVIGICLLTWAILSWSPDILVKSPPLNAGDMRPRFDPLEEGMAIHSSILAWRIPWTEKSGGLWSIGSQIAGHNWSDLAHSRHSWSQLPVFFVASLSCFLWLPFKILNISLPVFSHLLDWYRTWRLSLPLYYSNQCFQLWESIGISQFYPPYSLSRASTLTSKRTISYLHNSLIHKFKI